MGRGSRQRTAPAQAKVLRTTICEGFGSMPAIAPYKSRQLSSTSYPGAAAALVVTFVAVIVSRIQLFKGWSRRPIPPSPPSTRGTFHQSP